MDTEGWFLYSWRVMLWTEEQRQALGIKRKEQQLLDALHKKGTLNTVELAFEAKIPRVTVMRLLRPLKTRGFVARQTLKMKYDGRLCVLSCLYSGCKKYLKIHLTVL